jgi:hypothetical protein
MATIAPSGSTPEPSNSSLYQLRTQEISVDADLEIARDELPEPVHGLVGREAEDRGYLDLLHASNRTRTPTSLRKRRSNLGCLPTS